jgi:hypothetical protein
VDACLRDKGGLDHMTSVAPPICGGCTHLTGGILFDPKHPERPAVCDAFSTALGIPWDILLSKHDHREPYSGDHGILYDPKDKDAADYAKMIFDEG